MTHAQGHEAVLNRLLGPAKPELTCEQCFAELDRYVDLELAGVDADASIPGIRAHFEGCLACAEDHASLRDLASAYEAPSPGSASRPRLR